jgi:hypothetical protein
MAQTIMMSRLKCWSREATQNFELLGQARDGRYLSAEIESGPCRNEVIKSCTTWWIHRSTRGAKVRTDWEYVRLLARTYFRCAYSKAITSLAAKTWPIRRIAVAMGEEAQVFEAGTPAVRGRLTRWKSSIRTTR